MPDEKEKHSESRTSESEDERTLVEQSAVADLKEKIRCLKESLKMLLEKVNPSSTEESSPHQPVAKLVELPHSSMVPPTAPTCNIFMPPNNTKPSSRQPMQQKISIDNISLPTTFIPNVSLPYYSNTYMPPQGVQGVPLPPPRHCPTHKFTMNTARYGDYNYTNLENLSRLQKELKGDAKDIVEAYLIHPENVNQVMATLEFHYGRPQIMIRSQISKVRVFPDIPGNRIHEIINFSSMVSNLTVFLENAGAIPHLCNPTLLDELINKLPLAKREEWMKYSLNHLGQYPSVREFSVWLQEVATYVSFAMEVDGNGNEATGSKRGKIRPSFAITTQKTHQPICFKCKQSHYLNQCAKFKGISMAERWKFVKYNHLCFSCLHTGHNSLNCNNRRQCGLDRCAKYHNRLLHENRIIDGNDDDNRNVVQCQNDSDGTLGTVDENGSSNNTLVTTIVGNYSNKETLFKFLPVQLKGPNGCVNVIAFIDNGSKISLLEEKVAKQIGLQGPKGNLSLGWIGGKTSNEISTTINLEISSMAEDNCSFQMRNVRTTRSLQLPPQSLHIDKFKRKFPLLNDIVIDDYFDAIPKLLIGLPHTSLVRQFGIINLDKNFAVHQTKLGNILFGSNEEVMEATVCVIDFQNFGDVQQQVSEYFSLENFGMKAAEPVISEDYKRAEEILEGTTVRKGIHYETGLLWKQSDFEFKESFPVALKRLLGVEAKMRKDDDLAKWYKGKINEYVLKSYARKLPPEEAIIENNYTWYLPHFVITNVKKGNKRRLVFDAAALVEDMREMFHRIRIREEDQPAQRFLWRDGDSLKPPDVYVM
ncbi:uncharacterized protein LOC135949103 [Calliphora vicina]|uniref:uncharacterized protein LOC135949103 n=1 Tax=Calliphora vicina TaxID=7373 RepID=UPI00325BE89F